MNILGQRVSRLSYKERFHLWMKMLIFLVFIFGALWGHPPSGAQEPNNALTLLPLSGQDIKQNDDIAYMKALLDADKITIKEQGVTITEQGKMLASMDTKLTLFFWFIGAVVGGQIGFTLLPMRKRSE